MPGKNLSCRQSWRKVDAMFVDLPSSFIYTHISWWTWQANSKSLNPSWHFYFANGPEPWFAKPEVCVSKQHDARERGEREDFLRSFVHNLYSTETATTHTKKHTWKFLGLKEIFSNPQGFPTVMGQRQKYIIKHVVLINVTVWQIISIPTIKIQNCISFNKIVQNKTWPKPFKACIPAMAFVLPLCCGAR